MATGILLALAGLSVNVAYAAHAERRIKIGGYVGDRIELCINNRVKCQDTRQLVEPFRHLTEGTRWQTEFIGKWMLGAIASYRYTEDPELLRKIKDAAARAERSNADSPSIAAMLTVPEDLP